ncbi:MULTISPECIES: DNA polymerase III subunit alpha [unclassified Lentimicrobium]|uniref:DNA polymerase III subunit alpha n=1 Tax=unclassified Lentimicrobium TaxID=2677434 RepID=UPI001554CD16|nr:MULTISPECIES: DNA polymerase III subunit alpha [unclassified Lentimicrobium]NPD45440.1 DNA polymerase III subunit alpha [Lentimicrobium sp. S6]NPD83802.1 DNA polymerase III subunit alpha [Lentimicrobium sp. L6]
MFLIYDTETTGLPKDYNAPITNSDNWPRMVQISWQLHDDKGQLVEVKNYIIKPEGYEIPYAVVKVHGITTERAEKQGVALSMVLDEFNETLKKTTFVVGHNIEFDNNIIGAEFHRKDIDTPLFERTSLDTKNESTNYCAIPGGKGGKFKWPKLGELHEKLFGEAFDMAHNAAADVEATARCFLELVRLKVIEAGKLHFSEEQFEAFQLANPNTIQAIGLNTQPYDAVDLDESDSPEISIQTELEKGTVKTKTILTGELKYSHLHLHTPYSILDGATSIPRLAEKALNDGMEAVAITDHGNMFGVKTFHKILTGKGLKPILGCEVYVARRGMHRKEAKIDGSGWHLVLLAKNRAGYQNLMRMVSLSWLEGNYYKPRIDKELLSQNSEGLIALSACLGGEVNQKLMNESQGEAEKAALWYKDLFGEDFYLELQRHQSGDPELDSKVYEDQVFVNQKLLEMGHKYGIKVVATNDVHFVNKEDSGAQDRLICISTGKNIDDPSRLRYSGQEWFKTQKEMIELFKDHPECIAHTQEIVDKVENYPLNSKPIMPDFTLPEGFTDENEYLRHIVYEGAHIRWGAVLTEELIERLDFELETIKKMGFPGYFLIVWDFLVAARNMGVVVGPGRGSAAGSAVAYSLRITEIDPVKYNLLFERFLNPDRVSMPDIDIDFDDEGRGRIMEWVVNKYGEKRVAHIVTFGSLAAKSAIRDVGRVQQYPLSETMLLQKLVPTRPGISLKDAFKEVPELNNIKRGKGEAADVLKYAEVLEGSVRNTGVHACGVIIGKEDLENYVPISTAKDSELKYVTQYDGKHVEDIGLLKMDFLGLKTLTIIKHAVENIKESKGVEIDIENVNLEDEKTYQLYSDGDTTGLFQFESAGMKKYLKELKPTRFEDLIAMNALYRPGPLEYIPSFVKRKNGLEPIEYDLPMMKEYLEETYGITVYQEQVMLLSRQLANFTRGQSDSLRKAMGKKIKAMMDELKVLFIEGCKANERFMKECTETKKNPDKLINKIWGDWEAFAKYAFNKSHATCYSYVSYQTAYLKAHYPAEFMAAVLSNNMSDIEKVTFFIDDCRNQGFKVLGPDINESGTNFAVNKDGDIRFGLNAIKGVGGAAADMIIEERRENGKYKGIFGMVKRVNLRSVNKKSLESMVYAGAFDSFEKTPRHVFFHMENGSTFLEKIIQYGHKFQAEQNSNQGSLFGDLGSVELPDPEIPETEPWSQLESLKRENDVVGFYLSGHPLDTYSMELKQFCNSDIKSFNAVMERLNQIVMNTEKDKDGKKPETDELKLLRDKPYTIAGIISIPASTTMMTKTGKPFGRFTVEDYTGSLEINMFGENFEKYKSILSRKDQYVLLKVAPEKPRWRDEFELKINAIELLSEVMEKYVRRIDLSIKLHNVSSQLIDNLNTVIETGGGKTPINVQVIDENNEILHMNIPTKVNSKHFINALKDNEELSIRLVK